jgi:hypothetical protein
MQFFFHLLFGEPAFEHFVFQELGLQDSTPTAFDERPLKQAKLLDGLIEGAC